MYKQRPYKHTITEVTEAGTRLVVLGTYASEAAAVAAAKRADEIKPDETREVRLRNRTCRNRYAHGPVGTWVA